MKGREFAIHIVAERQEVTCKTELYYEAIFHRWELQIPSFAQAEFGNSA